MLFSHHALHTMTNPIPAADDPGPRVLQADVLALLLRFPNLVLWVNGHTHVNEVIPHPQGKGAKLGGGFWEVNTASHIDWPQHARLVEIADNRDGTLSIFGTVIDSAAPLSYGGKLDSSLHLAALSRELSVNDPQERESTRRGHRHDRNVELLVAAPFTVISPYTQGSIVDVTGHEGGGGDGSGGGSGASGSQMPATGGGRRAALTGAALLVGAAAVGLGRRAVVRDGD